ncbi:unnamed protein product [Protopolystoma xenopodis]|uniref:Uncharacterized protein n=1 Tax=Protopolystoma xenopodis TaxID=117903 RepID=A0A448WVX8_9PLAT|nr:unnamed protein product [Protopolystoma xenopodis]
MKIASVGPCIWYIPRLFAGTASDLFHSYHQATTHQRAKGQETLENILTDLAAMGRMLGAANMFFVHSLATPMNPR